MIDQTKLKKLQIIYLMTRSDKIYVEIDRLLSDLTSTLMIKILNKTHYIMPKAEFIDKRDEAKFRFLQMYLKNPEWYCTHFSTRLAMDIRYILYNNQMKVCPLEPSLYIEKEYKEPEDDVLGDIIKDTKYWRNIFLLCYKSRSYKGFILGIEPIVGKRWIYDHAKRLKKLYKNTRLK